MSQVQQAPERYKELPFQVLEYSPQFEIRKFDAQLTDEETQWHRDAEDRLVRLVEGKGWFIQLENKFPVPFRAGDTHYIPAEMWHRVIRTENATEMVVHIHKKCKTVKDGI